MKNINTIILAILCVAVAGLYVLYFTSGKKVEAVADKNASVRTSLSIDSLPIAYVNVDSLLVNYKYAKDLNAVLLKKQEKSRAEVSSKELQLRSDYAAYAKKVEAYQNKMATGQILTKETKDKEESVLVQEQNRIAKKDQDLKELDRRLSQELFAEQQKMNSQLRDSINAFFKTYNQDKRYKVIFSDTGNDNIFFAEDYLNITDDVVEELNKRYDEKK
ncbi:MAG: OmpH family outer membrane protein [Paludibacteraceae bacterium]|nr:OmpH family outer membrane protein [Paludibacteraceae bacterium]